MEANTTTTTTNTIPAMRGLGRLAYRTGGFPSHGVVAAKKLLCRDLTTAERQGIVDGWIAERREATS